MAYVEENDYSRIITKNDLDEILLEAVEDYPSKTTTEARQDAESMAQSKINTFLGSRFDMATEFALTPSETRDQVILYCYLTFAVYFIHMAISPRDIPRLRIREYNDCIKKLEKIRDGEISISLDPTEETFGSVVIAGNSKFISKPFTDANVVDQSNNATNP